MCIHYYQIDKRWMDGWIDKRRKGKEGGKEGREIEKEEKRKEGGEEKENKFEREWFRGIGSLQLTLGEQSGLSIADALF